MNYLRGEVSKPEKNDDCRVLAPFVMTLFDGEADEFEARRARAHLLVCQTCARRWLDWNRSRDLLCSAPIPAPPPQLLWRVLMACRLASAPKAKARQPLDQVLPRDFQSQILARTTRTNQTSASAGQGARRTVLMPMPVRWSQFAAPALVAWMLILQRDVWLPAPVAPPSTPDRAFLPAPRPRLIARRAKDEMPPSAPAESSQRARNLTLAKPALRAAKFDLPSVHLSHNHDFGRSSLDISQATLAASRALESSASGSQTARFQAQTQARPEPAVEQALLLVADEVQPTRATVAAPLARRGVVSVKLALLSNQNRTPHLRAAHWQSAPLLSPRRAGGVFERAPRSVPTGMETAAPQLLRVSLPSARAPQPARLLAEVDAEDEGVDDVRSVVDDFRATLGPDDATTADMTLGDEDPNG